MLTSSQERLLVRRLKSIGILAQACWNRLIRNALHENWHFREIPFKYEWPLPLEYKGVAIRLQAIVWISWLADAVVVEIKSVEAIAPVHEAQLLTYMRLGGWKVGLLINFNVLVLKTGIRRKVLALKE